MNAERLLQLYDRVSEAPNAIPRLRKFIFDLAVRGKLVEQDPNDQPAGSHLNRIVGTEDHCNYPIGLGDAGALRREEIPSNWTRVKLGDLLSTLKNGLNVRQNKTVGRYRVTRIETISHEKIDATRVGYVDEISQAQLEKHAIKVGDILFSHINSEAHLGKTAICDIEDERA